MIEDQDQFSSEKSSKKNSPEVTSHRVAKLRFKHPKSDIERTRRSILFLLLLLILLTLLL